jgi:hypothetical protein
VKRVVIFYLLFLIAASLTAQQEYEVPEIWNCPYPLDRKEIQDSGYKRLIITGTAPVAHPVTHKLWVDTLYSAVFDSSGYISDESFYESGERIVRKYEYINPGSVKRIFEEKYRFRPRSVDTTIISFDYKNGSLATVTYLLADRGGYCIYKRQQYDYDKYNRLVMYCNDDDTTLYYYNDHGQLIKEHEQFSPRYSLISIYNISRNDNDSIVKIKTYEISDSKMDSVFYEKRYDSAGRIFYVSQRLSRTYTRTFRDVCIEGENFIRNLKYDINGLVADDDVSYMDAQNNGWDKWSLQVVNNSVTVTTWLSGKSNLYYKVEQMNGRAGTRFIRFDYSK